MYFDRGALKRRAKHLVTQGNPPAYMVTLIFLLATTALATVVGLFLPNPVGQVDALYLNWFNTIMENGGEISQGSMNALTQQIMALFQGPMATAALLVALILGFYSMVVSFGYSSYALRVMRGMEGGGYQAPFSQFHMAGKVILIAVLRMVFVYLWTLLFIVPGIIALYRYRMAEYALLDDPEISCLEAIRRSKRMMQGHKMELFVLGLFLFGLVDFGRCDCGLGSDAGAAGHHASALPGDDGRFHRGDDGGDAGGQYCGEHVPGLLYDPGGRGLLPLCPGQPGPAGGRGRKRRLESGRPQQRLESGRFHQFQRLGPQRPQRLEPGGPQSALGPERRRPLRRRRRGLGRMTKAPGCTLRRSGEGGAACGRL